MTEVKLNTTLLKKSLYRDVPSEQVEMLLDFRKIEYREIKNWKYVVIGEGKPLVLLPGGFMNADMWFYIAQNLRGYKMLIPDSYVRQGVYNINDAAEKVTAMLAREGFKCASFLGLSAGGGLLQYLLKTKPEVVSSAILSHTGLLDNSRINKIRKIVKIAKYLPEFVLRWRLKRTTMQQYPDSEWRDFSRAFVFWRQPVTLPKRHFFPG